MKPLFPHWAEIIQRFQKASFHLFLFDFDGTLAPIAPTPAEAELPSAVLKRLRLLSQRPDTLIGIVSGRPIQQLRRHVRLPNLIYVGNHGLEIENNGWGFVHPGAQAREQVLRRLVKAISPPISAVEGALLENKGLSLSVHYRRVRSAEVPGLLRQVRDRLRGIPEARSFDLRSGKKVLEIHPVSHWGKGAAVRWLQRFVPRHTLIFYVGDDVSDEDAFRVLRESGMTVYVGRRKGTHARFGLAGQPQMTLLLDRLLALTTPKSNGTH